MARSDKARQLTQEIEEQVSLLMEEIFPTTHTRIVRDILVLVGRAEFHEDGTTHTLVTALPMNEEMPDYHAQGLMHASLDMYADYHGTVGSEDDDDEA